MLHERKSAMWQWWGKQLGRSALPHLRRISRFHNFFVALATLVRGISVCQLTLLKLDPGMSLS